MPATLTRSTSTLKVIDEVVAPYVKRGLVSRDELNSAFAQIGDIVSSEVPPGAERDAVDAMVAAVREEFSDRETVSHGEFFDAYLDLRRTLGALL